MKSFFLCSFASSYRDTRLLAFFMIPGILFLPCSFSRLFFRDAFVRDLAGGHGYFPYCSIRILIWLAFFLLFSAFLFFFLAMGIDLAP